MDKSGLRILIVDDNRTMRKVLADVLRAAGFKKLEYAADGRAALEAMVSDSRGYDLVLLDWGMPGMDGLQVLQTIRNDARIDRTPVIMVTAEALPEQVVKAAMAGATDYVVKPYTPDTIYTKIEKLLQKGA